MKKTIKTIAMLALVLGSTKTIAQNAAINSTGSAPDASSMLDVSSTAKGLLMPRMTLAQKTAIASPATGLTVYQTNGTSGYYYYDGASWTRLATASSPTFLTKTADYTILSSDVTNNLVMISNSGTTRVYTLPTAASVAAGNTIKITSNNMDFDVVAAGADVLLGVYGNGSISSSTFYIAELTSNGVDAWIITDALK